MSTYHKPKVYRSNEGCCICKAKSSSSRFTDSDKYEDDFEECFRLEYEERSGDICNACVLIVKRWRQLPETTVKDWSHVVDARAGPGHTKKMVQIILKPTQKRKLEQEESEVTKIVKKKRVEKVTAVLKNTEASRRNKRKNKSSIKRRVVAESKKRIHSDFIDLSYWAKANSCCGPVYIGKLGEVMLDGATVHSCVLNSRKSNIQETKTPSFIQDSTDLSCDKSFVDEDDDTDSISLYSDSDSMMSKESKTDHLTVHTDDEGFYDRGLLEHKRAIGARTTPSSIQV